MDLKTPGVYIEEISLFPPSVVPVATAIPAFVGYTQLTMDKEGISLNNKPVRISSLLEFNTVFGGLHNPAGYTVKVDAGLSITAVNLSSGSKKFYLYDALRQYFDNGGGPCYIVSVGGYDSTVAFGADDVTGIRGGLKALEKVDEPTILLVPDSVLLADESQTGEVHKKIADQCARLKDRFGILDIFNGHLSENSITDKPLGEFRNKTGTENLKYTAVYYPWLYSSYFKEVHFTQLSIVDSADAPVSDATIGDSALMIQDLRNRIADVTLVFSKIVSTPLLNRSTYSPLSAKFDSLKKLVTADLAAGPVRTNFKALMDFVRSLALAFPALETDAGTPNELQPLLTVLETDTALQGQIVKLIAYEKNPEVMGSLSTSRTDALVDTDYTAVDSDDWIGGVTTASVAADNAIDYTNGGANTTAAQIAHAVANSTVLYTAFTTIANAFSGVIQNTLFFTDQAEKRLFTLHPFYKTAYERIRKDMSLLPPSGAIAGVYAATDRNRGVWKSPANVSLRAVVAPAIKLNDRDQENLNVHPTGKSINVIRDFIGKGTLVWGARTLDGNSNEWRYISVRRFFNMVEESTKKATEPFVFEPNDANTWVKVRAMIENFLTLQWRAGALAGAKPEHAFYVKVGLGQTMTALDILEGRMIVEIGMAVVRPAEFIILRFSHKMQES